MTAAADSPMAMVGAVSATRGVRSALADRVDTEKSPGLAPKLFGPVPDGVRQAERASGHAS